MDDEEILAELDIGGGLFLRDIFLEGRYPVIFTCTDKDEQIYFGICCERSRTKIVWIITPADYEDLISLLTDKLPIRDTFLKRPEKKYMVFYDRYEKRAELKGLESEEIFSDYLPTEGAYMNADEGEFEEEIRQYLKKIRAKDLKERHRYMINKSRKEKDKFFVKVNKEYLYAEEFDSLKAAEKALGRIAENYNTLEDELRKYE